MSAQFQLHARSAQLSDRFAQFAGGARIRRGHNSSVIRTKERGSYAGAGQSDDQHVFPF